MDWETLKNDCLACQRCPLHTTRHNVVFGQGVENAEVLFVGEGPGQSEDEQGLPFVGRSGQLLDRTGVNGMLLFCTICATVGLLVVIYAVRKK